MGHLDVPLQEILADETLVLKGCADGASVRLDPDVAGHVPLALVLAEEPHTAAPR